MKKYEILHFAPNNWKENQKKEIGRQMSDFVDQDLRRWIECNFLELFCRAVSEIWSPHGLSTCTSHTVCKNEVADNLSFICVTYPSMVSSVNNSKVHYSPLSVVIWSTTPKLKFKKVFVNELAEKSSTSTASNQPLFGQYDRFMTAHIIVYDQDDLGLMSLDTIWKVFTGCQVRDTSCFSFVKSTISARWVKKLFYILVRIYFLAETCYLLSKVWLFNILLFVLLFSNPWIQMWFKVSSIVRR